MRDQERLHRVGDVELSLQKTVGGHPQTRKERAFSGRGSCEQKAWDLKQMQIPFPEITWNKQQHLEDWLELLTCVCKFCPPLQRGSSLRAEIISYSLKYLCVCLPWNNNLLLVFVQIWKFITRANDFSLLTLFLIILAALRQFLLLSCLFMPVTSLW